MGDNVIVEYSSFTCDKPPGNGLAGLSFSIKSGTIARAWADPVLPHALRVQTPTGAEIHVSWANVLGARTTAAANDNATASLVAVDDQFFDAIRAKRDAAKAAKEAAAAHIAVDVAKEDKRAKAREAAKKRWAEAKGQEPDPAG